MKYLLFIAVLLLAVSAVAQDSAIVRVADDSADCKIYATSIDLTSTDGIIGDYGADVGDQPMLFENVVIPQGATIDSAFIYFDAANNYSGTACNAIFYGEDTSSATKFSTYADYAARIRTTASVAWSNIEAWTIETVYKSPDIKDVWQEIVNRADWVPGNDAAIFCEDNTSDDGAQRRPAQYDLDAGRAALSKVYFTAAAASTYTGVITVSE